MDRHIFYTLKINLSLFASVPVANNNTNKVCYSANTSTTNRSVYKRTPLLNGRKNLYQRRYNYNANGNLTGVDDSRKGNCSYHYDPLDLLIGARGAKPEAFVHM